MPPMATEPFTSWMEVSNAPKPTVLRKTIILLFSFLSLSAFAQDTSGSLSLEECINLALQNNITMKRTELQGKMAANRFRTTRSEVLPIVNADYNFGINNGRSIDPYSNDYIDQQLSYSNAGLGLSFRLFKGFELRNRIQRERFNLKASEAETEEARQQLILDVTLAYFEILNNQDLLQLAKLSLKATEEQATRLQSLYDQGEGNPADYTDILGQVGNDRTSIIGATAQLEQSLLHLATLLDVDSVPSLDALGNPAEVVIYAISVDQVYADALKNLATVEAGQLKIEASRQEVEVARSLYSPEVNLFAQINTNYSSLARFYTESGTEIVETGNFITLDNVDYAVRTQQLQFSEQNISYLDQLNNNLNSVVGISVNLPVFNGFRARRSVQLSKIELEDSRLEMEDLKNQLQQEIRTAYTQMQAAYKNLKVLQDQVEAYLASYQVNEIRFTNGVSNFVEYIISKNNLDRARINLANAKYEYLIRVKVLEYYRGNTI